MEPDIWQRLEAVFFGALDLPEDERPAYLDRTCAGDPALRAEVDAVLAAHTGDAGGDAHRLLPSAKGPPLGGEMSGTRAGAYRLCERIGRGGMGDVYRAERVDDQYQQEVAVKLVRPGLADETVRRFALERQILARLQHPNIATLLDGGVTEQGQPYLVMQYVRGSHITEYADAHDLSIVERLRLFATVCDAVQFAHSKLVVHRDLKPSNILVTDDGLVRLLDFGIAKLLDPDWAGITAASTVDHRPMTPGYAAPEQLLGESITTATDVYALGVLLYALLTGALPFRATSTLAQQRAVCEQEPKRPSALARQVPGDLDQIVLMALRKEPERRYASAGQFGDDVSRFLAGRAVIAQRDTMGYRASKFIRRNRVAVGLFALAVVSLVVGLVATAWQARRAGVEAANAAVERDRAERVAGLMVDIFRLSDPSTARGQSITARELLDRGAVRIEEDFADQPELQADLLTELGQIYRNLGLYDEASQHLERALELRRARYGEDSARVAESLTLLAHLRTDQGRSKEAVALAEGAVSTLREGGGGDARALARALVSLGGALRLDDSPSEAEAAYQEAVPLLEADASPDDGRIAEAFFGWADAAHSRHRFDQAERLLRETIARFSGLKNGPHPELATSLHNLGMIRMMRGQPAEAEPYLRQALALRREIYPDIHADIADSLMGLTEFLLLNQRYEEGIEIGTEAVAVADTVWGETHLSSGEARQALGTVLFWTDQGERAVQVLEAASVAFRDLESGHPRRLGNEIAIGQAHASIGEFDRARALYTETLRRIGHLPSPQLAYRAHLLLELAKLDVGAGDYEAGNAKAQESLALTRKVLRAEHRFAQWANLILAAIRTQRGDLEAADALLREVLDVQRREWGEEHPQTARTLTALADVENRLGRPAQGEEHARLAVAIFEKAHEKGVHLAEARSVLGGALAGLGRSAEAEPLLRSSWEELAAARGATQLQVSAAAERLRQLTGRAK